MNNFLEALHFAYRRAVFWWPFAIKTQLRYMHETRKFPPYSIGTKNKLSPGRWAAINYVLGFHDPAYSEYLLTAEDLSPMTMSEWINFDNARNLPEVSDAQA